jgi:hypothetical protein
MRCPNQPPEEGGNHPPPGFLTVLNILQAQRDSPPGVQPSQPITHWHSSGKPEYLWDILAGKAELVPQDKLDAIRLAVS